MKAIILLLAIATICCDLQEPTVQTHRSEVPDAERKEIFVELGFNKTLDGFCKEEKKVLGLKVGLAVSNSKKISFLSASGTSDL